MYSALAVQKKLFRTEHSALYLAIIFKNRVFSPVKIIPSHKTNADNDIT